jgi:hypothetical protein
MEKRSATATGFASGAETDVIDPGSVIERGGGPVRTAVAAGADADAVVSRKSDAASLNERYAMNCLLKV